MVAYLEPQRADQFNGPLDINGSILNILPIEVVEDLIQPAETEANVGIFKVDGGPADPYGSQSFTEGSCWKLRNTAVDLRNIKKFLLPGWIGLCLSQFLGLCRQVAGVGNNSFQDLLDCGVELFL